MKSKAPKRKSDGFVLLTRMDGTKAMINPKFVCSIEQQLGNVTSLLNLGAESIRVVGARIRFNCGYEILVKEPVAYIDGRHAFLSGSRIH